MKDRIAELKTNIQDLVTEANNTVEVASWLGCISSVEEYEAELMLLDPTYVSVIED